MQTPPSLLPHDFCSPGRSNKWWHTTKPQEGCLSHSQSFAKKSMWRKQTHVSEASAASRSSASCSTWVAAWSFLHMTLFIIVHCCFLSSMLKPGRRIVRLCIRGREEEEELTRHFLLKHYDEKNPTLTSNSPCLYHPANACLPLFHSCRTHRHSSCLVIALLSVWM